jgi:hypothetical protein
MNGSTLRRLALGMCLVGTLRCASEERPRAEPQPLQTPQAAGKHPEVQQPTPDELPVPEDFEAEADREVTRSNLRAELDTIERELNADKRP